MFANARKGKFVPLPYRQKVIKAYRGGRVEAFQVGVFENVCAIDANSLYPYSAVNMPFPDIKTQSFIYRPLKYYSLKELLRFKTN